MAFFSSTLVGVKPMPVEIEIDVSDGLPFFQIVGLPDAVLKESKTRVKSAIMQSGFDFPYEKRVVLNLAPSKIKKEGSGFELGLAARILASCGYVPQPGHDVMFLGELALDGKVKSIPEIHALAYGTKLRGFSGLLVVPSENSEEISEALNVPVIPVSHLGDLRGQNWWEKTVSKSRSRIFQRANHSRESEEFLISKFSKFWAKHLVMATVGHLNYLLCGPPGCGKTYF